MRDVFEAVDHAKAYDHTFSLIQSRRLDEQPALRMYELFYQNTGPDDVGRYFDTRVILTGSRYLTTAPEKLDGEMKRLLEVPFPLHYISGNYEILCFHFLFISICYST